MLIFVTVSICANLRSKRGRHELFLNHSKCIFIGVGVVPSCDEVGIEAAGLELTLQCSLGLRLKIESYPCQKYGSFSLRLFTSRELHQRVCLANITTSYYDHSMKHIGRVDTFHSA